MLPDVLTHGQSSLGLDRHDLLDACGLGKSTVQAYRPHGQGRGGLFDQLGSSLGE